ncbi:MAG: single-stranded DNA-binding protein [Abditibacteriota bacterium]|nr:single-stranded DNA-binding protein [Abditibacteriota bacterium]
MTENTTGTITDDLNALLDILPQRMRQTLDANNKDLGILLEIVIDLGRIPFARFAGGKLTLSEEPVSQSDIDTITSSVSAFGGDNRAGIERTLHRISAIRNRRGKIIGLTCRVGRAVFGTVDIIRDVIEENKSILILGRPGVGKTTKLREAARILSDEFDKRVVIVDTSNEIGGDGDVPHPAIGAARRMQVSEPAKQHAVMIEAVENHMPEVVVIDEIGTEEEAFAARTIAERGVRLIATAHGNSPENLLMNPTLSDLVGGVQAVTLSDEEAKRRGTQKTVLERKAPPTFDTVIEILEQDKLAIHRDIGDVVDKLLRGAAPRPEIRVRNVAGKIEVVQKQHIPEDENREKREEVKTPKEHGDGHIMRIFTYGLSRERLDRAIREMRLPAYICKDVKDADVLITLKAHERRNVLPVQDARRNDVPVFVVKSNTYAQIRAVMKNIFRVADPNPEDEEETALREALAAADEVERTGGEVALKPANAYIRKLQHELIQRLGKKSRSAGEEPERYIVVFE